jgi:hypothetical protein
MDKQNKVLCFLLRNANAFKSRTQLSSSSNSTLLGRRPEEERRRRRNAHDSQHLSVQNTTQYVFIELRFLYLSFLSFLRLDIQSRVLFPIRLLLCYLLVIE